MPKRGWKKEQEYEWRLEEEEGRSMYAKTRLEEGAGIPMEIGRGRREIQSSRLLLNHAQHTKRNNNQQHSASESSGVRVPDTIGAQGALRPG